MHARQLVRHQFDGLRRRLVYALRAERQGSKRVFGKRVQFVAADGKIGKFFIGSEHVYRVAP